MSETTAPILIKVIAIDSLRLWECFKLLFSYSPILRRLLDGSQINFTLTHENRMVFLFIFTPYREHGLFGLQRKNKLHQLYTKSKGQLNFGLKIGGYDELDDVGLRVIA